MPQSKVKTQETQIFQDPIVIGSTAEENPAPIRICWNTGEEKNCPACYLRKGCKAKA
jgi:hypothetical protein